MIRGLTGAAFALVLTGAAMADPAPLAGWDKIHFGMTGKALVEAYPGVTWTEEAGDTPTAQKRSFGIDLEGGAYVVSVILTSERVSRVTLTKVLAPGLDEAACKAAFVPDEQRLRKQYGPPSDTVARGERWMLGGGSRVVIANVLFQPDDGSPAQCLVTQGYYPAG